MKKWRVYYEGEMIKQCTNEKLNVKLEVSNNLPVVFPEFYLILSVTKKSFNSALQIFQGEYSTELPFFDFDSDMDPWTIARAFAKETWSKEYFDRIRR